MARSIDVPVMMALEHRIMFDGAMVAEAVDRSLGTEPAVREDGENEKISKQHLRRDIIFIDSDILISNALGEKLTKGSEIVILDPSKNGLSQMAETLLGKSGINSIHIISHGAEGQVNIGGTLLNSENINMFQDTLAQIGRSLKSGGDILLYGCKVGEQTGVKFVTLLSEATGADIAASDDLTGNRASGGDWDLEVSKGEIEADTDFFSVFSDFTGVLSTPSVSEGGAKGYIKDSSAVIVSDTIEVTNGGSYGGGGSLEVSITNADSSETLSFKKVESAATTSNEVSIVGSNVYIGNGSGSNLIGTIDSTNNGENGRSLQVNFTSDSFTNPSFETGDLTGWTADTTNQIDLGSSSIAGIATPTDSSDPSNSGGDSDIPSTKGTWTSVVNTTDKSDGTYSLRLKSTGMQTANGWDVVHGPSVYSDIFSGEAGQTLKFDWRALGGNDAYDVFGYIVNTDTNATTEILNETGSSASGSTEWATADVTIPSTGNYRFVFVSGTYDFTGGRAAGASLYIDNFQVYNDVTDSTVSKVANLITYQTEATTLSASDRTERVLTFLATDADSNSGNNTATIFETFAIEASSKSPVAPDSQAAVDRGGLGPISLGQDGLQTFIRGDDQSGNTGVKIVGEGSGIGQQGSAILAPGDLSTSVLNNLVGQVAKEQGTKADPQNIPEGRKIGFSPGFIQTSVTGDGPTDKGLAVFSGISDPAIGVDGKVSFFIPSDAFSSSRADAIVTLRANQMDGSNLPSWLSFNPETGQFIGEVPPEFKETLEVVVTASDENGNVVTTSFSIENLGQVPQINSDKQTILSPLEHETEYKDRLGNKEFGKLHFSRKVEIEASNRIKISQLDVRNAVRALRGAGWS